MGVGASEFSGGVRSVVGVGGICQSWFVPTRASVFEIFVAWLKKGKVGTCGRWCVQV